MLTSSGQNLIGAINHQQPDKVVVDFGSIGVKRIPAGLFFIPMWLV
jgi:hypothetical protein